MYTRPWSRREIITQPPHVGDMNPCTWIRRRSPNTFPKWTEEFFREIRSQTSAPPLDSQATRDRVSRRASSDGRGLQAVEPRAVLGPREPVGQAHVRQRVMGRLSITTSPAPHRSLVPGAARGPRSSVVRQRPYVAKDRSDRVSQPRQQGRVKSLLLFALEEMTTFQAA